MVHPSSLSAKLKAGDAVQQKHKSLATFWSPLTTSVQGKQDNTPLPSLFRTDLLFISSSNLCLTCRDCLPPQSPLGPSFRSLLCKKKKISFQTWFKPSPFSFISNLLVIIFWDLVNSLEKRTQGFEPKSARGTASSSPPTAEPQLGLPQLMGTNEMALAKVPELCRTWWLGCELSMEEPEKAGNVTLP